MEKKNLLYYFLIPIVMVLIFLTICFSVLIFSPKNYVVRIFGYDTRMDIAYYRVPRKGAKLYDVLDLNTNAGYQFDGYYFYYNSTTEEFANAVPRDYTVNSNVTIYAKWLEV